MPRESPKPRTKKSAGTRGNVVGNGSKVVFPPSSEGQRLICLLTDSFATIARAADVGSKATIFRWRDGSRKPESAQRRHLKRAYGIPIESWDCEPLQVEVTEDAAVPVAPPVASEPKASVPSSSAEHFLELMHEVRATRTSHKLAPLEKLRAIEREGALRTQYERALGSDRALEELIVREHPAWSRFEELLLRALKPFPEALRAVGDALAKLHGGDR